MKLTDIDYSERPDMEDFIKWGVEPIRMMVDILHDVTMNDEVTGSSNVNPTDAAFHLMDSIYERLDELEKGLWMVDDAIHPSTGERPNTQQEA